MAIPAKVYPQWHKRWRRDALLRGSQILHKYGSAMTAENWFTATPESASAAEKPKWQMKADYVEACSCHLFCPCYFNKHAEHPHCEFNMAVKVREGHSGSTDLAGAKYWLTGDLGDEWGTEKTGTWVVVYFDPTTNQAHRHALA